MSERNEEETREVYQLIDQIKENLNRVSGCNSKLEDAVRRVGTPKQKGEEAEKSDAKGKSEEPETLIEKVQILQYFSRDISFRYERAVGDLDSLV